MFEYSVVKMTASHVKNSSFLNQKAEEGWELINVMSINQNPMIESEAIVHAYLKRKKSTKSTKKVING